MHLRDAELLRDLALGHSRDKAVIEEKTFAFGGGEIISRRRDALERITASIHLVNAFSLNLGIANHQSAWPNQEPVNDLRANETLFTLGGQYSLTW